MKDNGRKNRRQDRSFDGNARKDFIASRRVRVKMENSERERDEGEQITRANVKIMQNTKTDSSQTTAAANVVQLTTLPEWLKVL